MNDEQRDSKMQRWRRRGKPMPAQRGALPLERFFSSEERQQIARGVIPGRMEDKWLIYTEGDTIFFHRSWTGYCIFQVSLEQRGAGYAVQKAIVNCDEKQHNSRDAAYEAALLGFLIDGLLLGKPTSFPVRAGLPKNVAPGLFQHHVSGTAFPEGQASGESDGGWTA